jgi:hypothetical protein
VALACCRESSSVRVDAGAKWPGTLPVVDHVDACPINAAHVSLAGTAITLDESPAGSADGGVGRALYKPQRLSELYTMLRQRRSLFDGALPTAILLIDRAATALVAKSVLYSAAFAGYYTHFAIQDKAGVGGCLPVDTVLHYDFALISTAGEEGLHIDARVPNAFALTWESGDASTDEATHAASTDELTRAIRSKWAARGSHRAVRYLRVADTIDLATVLGWIELVRTTETTGPVRVVLSPD